MHDDRLKVGKDEVSSLLTSYQNVEVKYDFKVHAEYIAEVKRGLGLPMYDAPNAIEKLKQPRKHPTAEKVESINATLKHFDII